MNFNSYLTKEKVISILEDAGAKNIKIENDSIRCSCPLHGGDNPSAFVWNLEKNIFFCHTNCGGGDIITFYSILYDLRLKEDFFKILELISKDLDINIDLTKEKVNKDLDEWFSLIEDRVEQQQEFSISKLGENFFLNEYRGYTEELQDCFYNKTLNRIGFKILNENDVCVGVSLRAINQSDTAKWLHRPKGLNTGQLLYNYNNCYDYTEVIVVEGIMDVLAFKRAGFNNVVASFGANLTKEQIDLLLIFDTIILAFDGDEAGINARKKAIEKLKHKFCLFYVDYNLYNVKDADEMSKEQLEEINFIRI